MRPLFSALILAGAAFSAYAIAGEAPPGASTSAPGLVATGDVAPAVSVDPGAVISQNGARNFGDIGQTGRHSRAVIGQDGDDNLSWIRQNGDGVNSAGCDQSGGLNGCVVIQRRARRF